MKRVYITFLTFIFLVGLAVYITYYQNPLKFDETLQLAKNQEIFTDAEILNSIPEYISNGLIWEVLDQQRFFAWLGIVALIVTTFVAFLHLLIEKLFFKKFFEQPAIVPAVRRGLWFGLILVGIVLLRLIDGLHWFNVASIVALFICLEFVIVNLFVKKKE